MSTEAVWAVQATKFVHELREATTKNEFDDAVDELASLLKETYLKGLNTGYTSGYSTGRASS